MVCARTHQVPVGSTRRAVRFRTDLAVTSGGVPCVRIWAGSTVAGYTSAQSGQKLPVTFTIKNHSTTTSATVDFFFTITHATADASDFVCPLVSNHFNIVPDTPACEVGVLGAGKSTSAAILVTPKITTGTVTVRACAMNETGSPDPVSSNNCKTVSIPIT